MSVSQQPGYHFYRKSAMQYLANNVKNGFVGLLHPSSATGVIVLTLSVCVCVLPLPRLNGQTYGPDSVCRSSGRISRSSSKVKVIGQRSRSRGQEMLLRCLWPDGA